ncbi:hypothetical protein Pmani_000856 [Petrolisthes manimaculis]|uniref:G-protein coupled receptors family 1 profile domain-containing protein n=1 Tax=Petrolisthes manimaculis TaxID=1843537 RepID=A0AAE1QKT8_9EUCA|nr:hypothetical protein Pmani_000856 [Petrolisthes manimaculis]
MIPPSSMNLTHVLPRGPSLITTNLCSFQNVSGDIILVSCRESRPTGVIVVARGSDGGGGNNNDGDGGIGSLGTDDDPSSYDYAAYDYQHYGNFTDEQWGIVRQLNLYYVPLLIVVGFVGNLLSCVVFLNTRLRMRSSSYYLAALAIADVTYLFILFLVWLDLLGFNTFNVNVMCQLEIYLGSVSSSLSVWLTVAFTVERFIAVQYPLQRPTVCTVHRAKTIITTLSAFSVTVHLYVFVTAGVIVHQDEDGVTITECNLRMDYRGLMNVINWIDTLLTLVVPFIMIVVMNTLIARQLLKFSHRFRHRDDFLHLQELNGALNAVHHKGGTGGSSRGGGQSGGSACPSSGRSVSSRHHHVSSAPPPPPPPPSSSSSTTKNNNNLKMAAPFSSSAATVVNIAITSIITDLQLTHHHLYRPLTHSSPSSPSVSTFNSLITVTSPLVPPSAHQLSPASPTSHQSYQHKTRRKQSSSLYIRIEQECEYSYEDGFHR